MQTDKYQANKLLNYLSHLVHFVHTLYVTTTRKVFFAAYPMNYTQSWLKKEGEEGESTKGKRG